MIKVFAPQGIDGELKGQLNEFVDGQDFPCLYKSYNWRRDTYAAGFPDILILEKRLVASGKTSGVTLEDIRAVARWGGNNRSITIVGEDSFRKGIQILINTDKIVEQKPEIPADLLDKSVMGISTTYVSKVLRFILPNQYGAIDTRLVRVLGNGDQLNQKHSWLRMRADESAPKRWNIYKDWLGYGEWVNILRYFAQNLPNNCPHPQAFVDAGLREGNEWTCADVEMALFSYASQVIERQKRNRG